MEIINKNLKFSTGMKKLKNKIESFKYIAPIVWKTIKFRIMVWWHKKLNE